MLGYLSPALMAALSNGALPPQDPTSTDPYPVQVGGVDPLAPQAPAAPPPPDNPNDGINSVGRPSDAQAEQALALKKLSRQGRGQALMALGAELLGARNFGEGLSKGVMAYQQTLRSFRPTSKTVGDGEYEAVTDPLTGKVTYQPTPIHADKLAERRKPVMGPKGPVQYGTDASGNYDGTVKELAPPSLEPKVIKDAAGNETIVFVNNDTGEVFDAKGSRLSGPTAPAPVDSQAAPQAPTADIHAITAATESNNHDFNPDGSPVTSTAGAKYGMQVLPSTAKAPGFGVTPAASDTAPEYDRVGNQLLDKFQAKYNGDMPKAWAAYNWGPGKVAMAVATYGNDWLNHAPKSVQAYVAKNMKAMGNSPPTSSGVQTADTQPYYPVNPTTPSPAASPDNPWGLQPHSFAPGGPAVRFASPAELKAAGLPTDSVAQVDAKGNYHLLEKGTQPGDGPLPPDVEEFYARAIVAGTPMSQLIPGFGKAAGAQRRQVMSRVAKDAGAEGLTGQDFSVQLAHYKAAVGSVQNLEKQFTTIKGNEDTAMKNGEAFITASRNVPNQTRSTLLNRPIQSYLRSTGDPNIAAMDLAAQTFANEYAKVIAGTPTGAGTLTDSARNEALQVLRGDYSLSQKLAAYNQAKIDMGNRIDALHGNLQSTYAHMGDKAPELTGRQPTAPQPGAVVRGFRFKGGNPADKNNWTKM